MRIVHLTTSDSGGAGIAASRIHQSLLRAGVSSDFISLHRIRTDIPRSFNLKEIYFREMSRAGRLKHFLKRVAWAAKLLEHPYYTRRDTYLLGRPPGFELFSIPDSAYDLSVLKLVSQADIVHLHWVTEGFLDYETFFPRIGKKVLWTLHDMNPFTGGCHHADDCTGFVDACRGCPQLKGAFHEELAADILRRKSVALSGLGDKQMNLVAPSGWMKNLSAQSRLFRRFRHVEIPNPVDESVFHPREKSEVRRELNLPAGDKIILFIAKDVDNERKGFRFLVEALTSLAFPGALKVCSVGNFEKNIFPEHLHIPLGYVNDEEKMSKIYAAADLFVLPSLAENLPNTICEALLCGTPVAAFDVGGIPSLVNPQNGFLVEYKNAAALAGAIKQIAEERVSFDRQALADRARTSFSMETVSGKYKSVYQQLLDD